MTVKKLTFMRARTEGDLMVMATDINGVESNVGKIMLEDDEYSFRMAFDAHRLDIITMRAIAEFMFKRGVQHHQRLIEEMRG